MVHTRMNTIDKVYMFNCLMYEPSVTLSNMEFVHAKVIEVLVKLQYVFQTHVMELVSNASTLLY